MQSNPGQACGQKSDYDTAADRRRPVHMWCRGVGDKEAKGQDHRQNRPHGSRKGDWPPEVQCRDEDRCGKESKRPEWMWSWQQCRSAQENEGKTDSPGKNPSWPIELEKDETDPNSDEHQRAVRGVGEPELQVFG